MFPPGLQRKQPAAALGDSVQISTIFCQVLLQEQSQTALALETETEHLQRVQASQGSRQMVRVSVRRAVRMMTAAPRREYKPQNTLTFNHKRFKESNEDWDFSFGRETPTENSKIKVLIRSSGKYFILKTTFVLYSITVHEYLSKLTTIRTYFMDKQWVLIHAAIHGSCNYVFIVVFVRKYVHWKCVWMGS